LAHNYRLLRPTIGLICGLLAGVVAPAVHAQNRPAAGPAPAAPAPAAPPPVQDWNSFPTMLLEKIYRGPLRDTIVQRWRDPIDGSVCFLYIPISTPMLPQPAEGYMQYGPNQIGSISCVHPTQVLQLWQGSTTPPPVPAPSTRR
jgi:hypothetical protein